MKIFYESLTSSVEVVYDGKSTLENVLHLEDMFDTVTKDIYVQYKKKTFINIAYTSSSIDVSGVIKCKNNIFFINNYKSTYFNFTSLENTKDNKIRIKIINSDISGNNIYRIGIYNNNTLIETLDYTDKYQLYNNKSVKIYSNLLGCYITITLPLYLVANEYIEYTVYTIYVTEEAVAHKYLCIYDKLNNALIFGNQYKNNEISLLVMSKGSILRASTINDLYRLNANSFVQYDEVTSKLTITSSALYKDGDKLKYIQEQSVTINPEQLNVGYSLIGIYIDENSNLLYDAITSHVSYSTLMDSLPNKMLDSIRKLRQYYGFIIGVNSITKFTPLNI